MTRGDDRLRTGLRTEDSHASWREVYAALDVDPDQHEHEPGMYQRVPHTLDESSASLPGSNR